MSRKSIGPVVSIALLLVVAVVAVVGFQSWFGGFSSEVFTDIEQKFQTTSQINIKGLIDSTLYLKTNGENLSMLKISDSSGTLCEFSGNDSVSNQDLLIHWTFDNLTFNGTNYFVPDISGNGYDGLVLSENRNRDNSYFIASINTNTTYITFSFYYRKNNSGLLNGCYIKYGSQTSKILNHVDTDPNSWSGQEVFLETPLSGMGSGEKFSFICNQTNFYNVDGSIFFDGVDDFIFLENSESFVNSFLDYNNNFTLYFKLKSSIGEYGQIFSSRVGCGAEKHLFVANKISDAIYDSGISKQNVRLNITKNSLNSQIVVSNSYGGVNSTFSFSVNNLNKELITNVTKYQEPTNLLVLGKSLGCNNNDINGYLYDFRVYNRTLSKEEISTLNWNSIKQIDSGISEIDLSGCNLAENQKYDVVLGTEDGIIEGIYINN
ncbi:MAG: hypothetical protein ACOCXG_04850 [Nanoarchaeota archaeon]